MATFRTKVVFFIAVTCCLVNFDSLTAQDKKKTGPYEAIDRHALSAPEEAERSVASLSDYLTKSARTDRDKARAIFRWMTDRIAYNAEDFLANKPIGDCSAQAVLKGRKTVCEGYANLFEQLGQGAGLEIMKIDGFARGFGYAPGQKITTNHAWNAVKLNGQWQLIDSTWGSGVVDKKGFIKKFNEYYFLTPADQLIFSHLPNDPKNQLLAAPVSQETFSSWPKINIQWFKFGFAPKDIRDVLSTKDFRGFARAFGEPGQQIRVSKAPLKNNLAAGTSYEFQIEAPDVLGLAVINNDKWQHITPKNGVYQVAIKPVKGELEVRAKYPGKGASFWLVLGYVVE